MPAPLCARRDVPATISMLEELFAGNPVYEHRMKNIECRKYRKARLCARSYLLPLPSPLSSGFALIRNATGAILRAGWQQPASNEPRPADRPYAEAVLKLNTLGVDASASRARKAGRNILEELLRNPSLNGNF